MKIYFAGAIRGGREDSALYLEIVKLLRAYGEVLTGLVPVRPSAGRVLSALVAERVTVREYQTTADLRKIFDESFATR